MTLFFGSVLVALCVSALCSLLEAAVLSLPPSYVATLSVQHPATGAIWKRFKQHIEKPIAVILILNTAAHTVGATLAGSQFEEVFGEKWLVVFSLIFTYLMLQFTEILPKTLGVRFSKSLAPVIAAPLEIIIRVTAPLVWFIHLVNRPFERQRQLPTDSTLEEIAAMAASARFANAIDFRQAKMITAASRLDDVRVRQVMTPRTEVMYLRLDQPVEEILGILRDNPYTRLPLCDKDIDNVVGMVHIKDLFQHLNLVPGSVNVENIRIESEKRLSEEPAPETGLHVIGSGNIDLRQIRRDVLFLPEHTPVLEALRRFQESRVHLGIVVSEYGSTEGIVTLEDAVEEVVGEIQDEFDPPLRPMIVKEKGGYRINGRFPLHDLKQYVFIAEDLEGVDTVGGYMARELGKMPEAGEAAKLGDYTLRVLAADARRVKEVFLEVPEKPEATIE